jgi:hypothetical protein
VAAAIAAMTQGVMFDRCRHRISDRTAMALAGSAGRGIGHVSLLGWTENIP